MHRIDGRGATEDNRFTEGNPISGVPATEVTDDWLNDLQEEIISVLAAAGITPVKGVQNQLLQAIRSAGVFQTAPQFANDTRPATDAFVQRALGNLSGQSTYSVNAVLAAADAGKRITTLAPITLTLPPLSTVAVGARFLIRTIGGSVTVQRQDSDVIYTFNLTDQTSLSIGTGQLAIFVAGPNNWNLEEGDASLKYSFGFQASLLTNGFQRLPSGAQECRGTFTASATPGAAVPVTFPLAFAQLQELIITPVNASTAISAAWHDSAGPNGFNGRCNVAGLVCHYIAKGTY